MSYKKGFTLVELLGVFVILSIIVLVTFPYATGLLKNTKDKLIQKGGSLSQSKVKSYLENADLSNGTIEKGKDIPYNKR